jgi:hypothetical protein
MMKQRSIVRVAAVAAALGLAAASTAWAQASVTMGNSTSRSAQAEAAGATVSAEPAARGPATTAIGAGVSKPSQAGEQLPTTAASPATTRDTRPPTDLMSMGGYGGSAGTNAVDLGAVLNTGAWSSRRDNSTKICPPGLVNRNNFCSPPAGSAMSR